MTERKLRTHHVSATALATPRYSASTLGDEMTPCRLDEQEMTLSPKNTQYQEVEWRETRHPLVCIRVGTEIEQGKHI